MAKSVFCIVRDYVSASRIVTDLEGAGFTEDDISLLMPDRDGSHDFAHERSTKAPEGAAAGVSAGGAIGGTLGLLAGIGTLAIPGLGPFIAAGPIMAALSGAAVGAAVGGVTGALVGLGVPEYEAKRYEGKIKGGNVLVSVHAENSDQAKTAKEIFERDGGEDIATSGEASVPEPAKTKRPITRRDPTS